MIAQEEDIAVVFSQHASRFSEKVKFLAENQTSSLILHNENHDEQQDHGALRTPNRHVLRQSVVPDSGLQEMEQNKQSIGAQGQHVDPVKPRLIRELLRLGIIDKPPNSDLMERIPPPKR